MYRILKINRLVAMTLFGALLVIFILSAVGVDGADLLQTNAEEPYPELFVTTTQEFKSPDEPCVYLTFDDGPSENTPAILDVLKKYDVKATFFVMGTEEGDYRPVYRRIVEEGHSIGVHTYSHRYDQIYQSLDAYLEDFNRIDDFIYETTGIKPKIFRFPGGSANYTVPESMRQRIVNEMARRGFIHYDWNVVSGDDTSTVYPPETLAANVMRGVKDKTCVVVLLHDAPICTTTPQAVEMIIQQLKERGFAFDRITEEVKPIQFTSATSEK